MPLRHSSLEKDNLSSSSFTMDFWVYLCVYCHLIDLECLHRLFTSSTAYPVTVCLSHSLSNPPSDSSPFRASLCNCFSPASFSRHPLPAHTLLSSPFLYLSLIATLQDTVVFILQHSFYDLLSSPQLVSLSFLTPVCHRHPR